MLWNFSAVENFQDSTECSVSGCLTQRKKKVSQTHTVAGPVKQHERMIGERKNDGKKGGCKAQNRSLWKLNQWGSWKLHTCMVYARVIRVNAGARHSHVPTRRGAGLFKTSKSLMITLASWSCWFRWRWSVEWQKGLAVTLAVLFLLGFQEPSLFCWGRKSNAYQYWSRCSGGPGWRPCVLLGQRRRCGQTRDVWVQQGSPKLCRSLTQWQRRKALFRSRSSWLCRWNFDEQRRRGQVSTGSGHRNGSIHAIRRDQGILHSVRATVEKEQFFFVGTGSGGGPCVWWLAASCVWGRRAPSARTERTHAHGPTKNAGTARPDAAKAEERAAERRSVVQHDTRKTEFEGEGGASQIFRSNTGRGGGGLALVSSHSKWVDLSGTSTLLPWGSPLWGFHINVWASHSIRCLWKIFQTHTFTFAPNYSFRPQQ